jgi:nucleotide-binding universal stress UspA family protein
MNRYVNVQIVVPIDFSDEATGALDQAIEIAGAPERVTAIHVAPPLTAFEPAVAYQVIDDAERQRNIETAFSKRHAAPKYGGVRFEVRFGDPGHEIADFAKQLGAGLIVMPSHGRTGLAHLLIGSVAERVVRLPHCPVFCVEGVEVVAIHPKRSQSIAIEQCRLARCTGRRHSSPWRLCKLRAMRRR